MSARLVVALIAVAVPIVAPAAMLERGSRFPEWKLVDQTGKAVSSSDVAGKTYLLWFYPKAMTGG